jgi:hypothetical protein
MITPTRRQREPFFDSPLMHDALQREALPARKSLEGIKRGRCPCVVGNALVLLDLGSDTCFSASSTSSTSSDERCRSYPSADPTRQFRVS